MIKKIFKVINPKKWPRRIQWTINQVSQLQLRSKTVYDENRFNKDKLDGILHWCYVKLFIDGLLFRIIHYCFLITFVIFLNFMLFEMFHFDTNPNFQIGKYFIKDTAHMLRPSRTLYFSIWNKNLWPYFTFLAFWGLNSIVWLEIRKKTFNSLEVENPEETFSLLFPKRSRIVEKLVNFRLFLWDFAKIMIFLSIVRRFTKLLFAHFSRIYMIKESEERKGGYKYARPWKNGNLIFAERFVARNVRMSERMGTIEETFGKNMLFFDKFFKSAIAIKRYNDFFRYHNYNGYEKFKARFDIKVPKLLEKIATKHYDDFRFLYRPQRYMNKYVIKKRFDKRLWDRRGRWWQKATYWMNLRDSWIHWSMHKLNQIRFVKYYAETGVHFKPFFNYNSTLRNSILGFWILAFVLNENLLLFSLILNSIGQSFLTIYLWLVYLIKKNKLQTKELEIHSEFMEAPEENFSRWRLQSLQYTAYYKYYSKYGSAKQVSENKNVRAWDPENHFDNVTPYWKIYIGYLEKLYFEINHGTYMNKKRALKSIYDIRNYVVYYRQFPNIEYRSIPRFMSFEYDINAFTILLIKYKLNITRPYRVFIHFFKTIRPISTPIQKCLDFIINYMKTNKNAHDLSSYVFIAISIMQIKGWHMELKEERKITYDKDGDYDDAYEEYLKYREQEFIKQGETDIKPAEAFFEKLNRVIKLIKRKISFNTKKRRKNNVINFVLNDLYFFKYFFILARIFYVIRKIDNLIKQYIIVKFKFVEMYTNIVRLAILTKINWPIGNQYSMETVKEIILYWINAKAVAFISKVDYKIIFSSKKSVARIPVEATKSKIYKSALPRSLARIKKNIIQIIFNKINLETITKKLFKFKTNNISNNIIRIATNTMINTILKINERAYIISNSLIKIIDKIWSLTKAFFFIAIITLIYIAIYYAFINFEDPVVVVPVYRYFGRGIFFIFSILGISIQLIFFALLFKKTPFGSAINNLKRIDIFILLISSLSVAIFSTLKLKRIVDSHVIAHLINNGSKQEFMIRWALERKPKQKFGRFNHKRFHNNKNRSYPYYPEPSFNPLYSVATMEHSRFTINAWYQHSSQHETIFKSIWWIDAPPTYPDHHRLISLGPKYIIPHYMPAEELNPAISNEQKESIKIAPGSKQILEYYRSKPNKIDIKYEGLQFAPWYDYRKNPAYDPNKDPFFYSYHVVPLRTYAANRVPTNISIETNYKPLDIK